jgi:ubiquinone/menaquinone biosynthesis C-methylase UbiE
VYTEELLKLGYETTGMDISGEMIEACKRRFVGLPNISPAVHLKVGDVDHLPFPDASFDLVLCIGVLGYLIDDERAVRELVRVTKPGGSVVVNVTNAFSLSDLDTRARTAVRGWLFRREATPTPLPALPYAIRSAWMERTRQYANKSYRLRRFEQFLESHGLTLQRSFTFGFEFRILRRRHLLPAAVLDALELAMERAFMAVALPYLSRSGWGYVGVFGRGPA